MCKTKKNFDDNFCKSLAKTGVQKTIAPKQEPDLGAGSFMNDHEFMNDFFLL